MKHPLKFSLFEMILISNFAVLIVVAKFLLRFPIHVPGWAGIYWMAILIIGRRVVNRTLTGTFIGLLSGILATFLGLGQGLISTLPQYIMPGIIIDILLIIFSTKANIITFVLTAACANLAKLIINWFIITILGIPAIFITIGMTPAAISHVVFGIMGGIVGYSVIKSLEKAHFFEFLAQHQVAEPPANGKKRQT